MNKRSPRNTKIHHSDDLLFSLCDAACVRAYRNEKWQWFYNQLLSLCQALENNGWKKQNGMTQQQKIINHFKKTGSITQREAMIEYSVGSLTKVISELRKDGHNIASKRKYHPITGAKYVRYVYGR